MEIQYNVPFEVTKEQHNKLMINCAGIVTGREENGKYYIKVWLMKYKEHVEKILESK